MIFVVEEQGFHIHRWILELRGEDKTEIALPSKKSLQFQELTLMVYFLADRPMIIKNCFFLLIIYMKKLLDCDWLRVVQFKCNTSAKSVTPVQKV